MKPMPPEELLAILTAGARLAPEKSRALPAASYRDPADSVRLAGEVAPKKRKEKLAKVNKKWR
jgi:hypothetical protein